MAWETNITLEASLAFGRMEGKMSLILEKPGTFKLHYECKVISLKHVMMFDFKKTGNIKNSTKD